MWSLLQQSPDPQAEAPPAETTADRSPEPDLAAEMERSVTDLALWVDRAMTATEGSVPELIGTAAILLLGFVAYLVISRLIRLAVNRTHLDESIGVVLRTILRWVAVLLIGAAILARWGVLEDFWTAVTAAMALVAIGFFAVWSVLSNVLCSVILMANRPFRIGDHLELPSENARGTVAEINLLHTTLRDEDGTLMQIPNNLFFQKVVKRRPKHLPHNKLFGVLKSLGVADDDRGSTDSMD